MVLLLLLSPAKALSSSGLKSVPARLTSPVLPAQHAAVLRNARALTKAQIKSLMSISDDLASLNHQRYAAWDKAQTMACGGAFDGPAFKAMNLKDMDKKHIEAAQERVRVLSGLYGVLKPYDEIKPYRLEMGTKLDVNGTNKTLADYWRPHVVQALNDEFRAAPKGAQKILVNAASQEYAAAVDFDALSSDVEVVTCEFKTNASVYAKQARGGICRFCVTEQVETVDGLRGFTGDEGEWKFTSEREEPLSKGSQRIQRILSFERGATAPKNKGNKKAKAPEAAGAGAGAQQEEGEPAKKRARTGSQRSKK